MAGPIASTDIVTLAVALGLMIFLDVLGYRTKIGTMYIASLMVGVYTIGSIFANQSIVYSVTQLQTNSTFFTTYVINGNLWAVIFSVMCLVTFLLLYYGIEDRR